MLECVSGPCGRLLYHKCGEISLSTDWHPQSDLDGSLVCRSHKMLLMCLISPFIWFKRLMHAVVKQMTPQHQLPLDAHHSL